MFYSHIGTVDSKLVEVQAKTTTGYPALAIMLDGKIIGDLWGSELQQLIQYIVNRNGVDIDELAERKRLYDKESA